MAEFRMPSLGADMTSGTLAQWMVQPGDRVSHGDVIAVVETQKGSIDVEIWEDGTVTSLVVPEGTEVPVGALLAELNGGASASAGPERAAPEAAAERPVPSSTVVTVEPPATNGDGQVQVVPAVPTGSDGARLHVSPLARRRAAELKIDLREVHGTRPGGAIALCDVERAAQERGAEPAQPAAKPVAPPEPSPTVSAPAPEPEAPSQAPAPVTAPAPADTAAARYASMRAAIAAAMTRANQEIPHYYLATDIDMQQTLRWLESENLKRSVSERLLYAVPLIRAVALALRDYPDLNGFYMHDVVQPSEAVHIGWAIALRQGGLVAPAIHDADILTVDEVMERLRDLITRARGGKLKSSEMMDPTITVTSLGDQGVPEVYGVIYPPQLALVGFGKIVDRPWAVDGMLTVRPVMRATLAADHRASDGHRGGLFLAAIERYLQEPEKL